MEDSIASQNVSMEQAAYVKAIEQAKSELKELRENYRQQCACCIGAFIFWQPGVPMNSKLLSSRLSLNEASIQIRLQSTLKEIIEETSEELENLLNRAQVREWKVSHIIHQIPFTPLFLIRHLRQILAQRARGEIQLILDEMDKESWKVWG